MSTIVVMTTDKGTISWQEVTRGTKIIDDEASNIAAGGWLFGPKDMTRQIKDILHPGSDITGVDIIGMTYHFTDTRDTPADVVAAMYAVGIGKGLLSPQGWDIMYKVIPELLDSRLEQL